MLRSRARDLALLFAVLALLAACGSSSGGSANGSSGNDDTEATQSEATPSTDDGSDDGNDGGSDDGNGDGTGSFDLERAFEILTPPNAEELSKTTASGIIFAAWDTDDSLDALRSFYEAGMDEAGLEVISTTEAQGGIAWVVADRDDSGIGGSISIFPASDGTGTQVSVTIGEGG